VKSVLALPVYPKLTANHDGGYINSNKRTANHWPMTTLQSVLNSTMLHCFLLMPMVLNVNT